MIDRLRAKMTKQRIVEVGERARFEAIERDVVASTVSRRESCQKKKQAR